MPKPRSTRIAQAVFCLSVAVAATPAAAQLTFDEVEAALSALERSVPAATPLSPAEVIPTPIQPVTGGTTTPPPGILTPEQGVFQEQTITFLPIPDDVACPQGVGSITDKVNALQKRVGKAEAKALEIDQRFATLEEQNRAYEVDPEINLCPEAFLSRVEAFVSDLSEQEFATTIQEAETLSVCAQSRRQETDARMSALAESADPDDARERLTLGNVLNRWAEADVRASEAVSSLVFFDQRRGRLKTAGDSILRRCALLEGRYD